MYAHLSTSASTLLEEAIVYTHSATGTIEAIPPLKDTQSSEFARLTLNLAGDVPAGGERPEQSGLAM